VNNLNLAYAENNEQWNLAEWNYIVEESAVVFRLTDLEKNQLSNSTTARIIATIPFAANCEDAERTAIAHICLYLAELKGFQKYCAHVPSDDSNIFNRLDAISDFKGGNKAIINHGMNLLALKMLEGYKHSSQKDEKNGIYNPLVSGNWNYKLIKNDLLNKLSKIECPALDDLFYSDIRAQIW